MWAAAAPSTDRLAADYRFKAEEVVHAGDGKVRLPLVAEAAWAASRVLGVGLAVGRVRPPVRCGSLRLRTPPPTPLHPTNTTKSTPLHRTSSPSRAL